jgi:hypothetical protein
MSTTKKTRTKTKPPPTPGSPLLPPWVPNDRELELVPDAVRQAVNQVVQPVYERFVLDSSDPLEKSLGVTVTHLLWLEILQQADLKREYTEITAVLGTQNNHHREIDQHLRIIESKVKVGYLLTHIQELRRRWNRQPPDHPTLPEPHTIDVETPPPLLHLVDQPPENQEPAGLTHPLEGPNHGKTQPC